MRGILIDPIAKTITEVEIGEPFLDSAYRLLGCDIIEMAFRFNRNKKTKSYDVIYVDEEGLLKDLTGQMFFTIAGGHQPFAGKGLISAVDDEGMSVATTRKISRLPDIEFLDLAQVQALAATLHK